MTDAHQAGIRQPLAVGEHHIEGPISTNTPGRRGDSSSPSRSGQPHAPTWTAAQLTATGWCQLHTTPTGRV
jgi:hypothetical protein